MKLLACIALIGLCSVAVGQTAPKPHKAKTPAKPKEKPLHWEGDPGPMPDGFISWSVEQLECHGINDASLCTWQQPSKPLDLSATMEQAKEHKTTYSYDGCNTTTYVDGQPALTTAVYCTKDDLLKSLLAGSEANVLYAKDASAVKLSDSEYSHLQQLRSAVVEEEKRLAVKYGASIDDKNCGLQCATFPEQRHFDHYEFHGRFLLIDKGSK